MISDDLQTKSTVLEDFVAKIQSQKSKLETLELQTSYELSLLRDRQTKIDNLARTSDDLLQRSEDLLQRIDDLIQKFGE